MADGRVRQLRTRQIRRVALTALGFVFSGVALYLVFRGSFNVQKLASYVTRIEWGYLILSVVFYWGGVQVIRSFLIEHLLESVGKVRKTVAFRYICIGFLANNILPLRIGEAVRIAGIAKRSNISVASVAGGLVIERIMDLTMAAVIGVIAIQLAPIPEDLRFGILASGAVLVIILVVLAAVVRRGLKETDSLRYGRLIRFVWNLAARFVAGFGGLGSAKKVVITVVLSAALWALATGTIVLRLMAFGLPPSLPMGLVLMASISLGISIPSAPSAIGVYHWLAAHALMIMGVENDLALGFAFFCHLVDFVSSSGIGVVCMLVEGIGWSDLTASADRLNREETAGEVTRSLG